MTNPVVKITEGEILGIEQQDYLGGKFLSFLGIPYGKPPIGELRFKAPVEAEPWKGILDCTKPGPESPAKHMFFAYHIGSENNCLNLNVYTKNLPNSEHKSSPKPVMVWIHGGAFFYGSNKPELFGPDYLMTEDIVLVNINYRLGVLGFLSLEDPSLGVPGNAGMKDMILALKWVQKNISNFNGDPNNVTIFGESAGSASVHYLYMSPMSKGLFHKAIAQSGCALNAWARGESNGKYIAKDLGFKETDEKKIFEFLKTVSPERLVRAQHKYPDTFIASSIRPYGPVVEKASPNEPAFLPEDPVEILKKGTFNHVPLIMGYMSKEGIFFEAVRKLDSKVTVPKNFEEEVPFEFAKNPSINTKDCADKIEKFYFPAEKPSEATINQVYLLKSDNQFVHGIHRSVNYQKAKSTAPIYLYRVSLETPMNYYKNICMSKGVPFLFLCYFVAYKGFAKNLFLKLSKTIPAHAVDGACHADDLGFLFKSFLSQKVAPDSLEDVSIKRFVKLWTNFARTGNPTPDFDNKINANSNLLLNNVQWKPVTKEENRFLDIGKELTTGTNPDRERMQFWDSLLT